MPLVQFLCGIEMFSCWKMSPMNELLSIQWQSCDVRAWNFFPFSIHSHFSTFFFLFIAYLFIYFYKLKKKEEENMMSFISFGEHSSETWPKWKHTVKTQNIQKSFTMAFPHFYTCISCVHLNELWTAAIEISIKGWCWWKNYAPENVNDDWRHNKRRNNKKKTDGK